MDLQAYESQSVGFVLFSVLSAAVCDLLAALFHSRFIACQFPFITGNVCQMSHYFLSEVERTNDLVSSLFLYC